MRLINNHKMKSFYYFKVPLGNPFMYLDEILELFIDTLKPKQRIGITSKGLEKLIDKHRALSKQANFFKKKGWIGHAALYEKEVHAIKVRLDKYSIELKKMESMNG